MNLYLVVLTRRAGFDPAVVPLHQKFLDELRADGRNEKSGPFGDKSGGAYLLRAADLTDAEAVARRDPAYASGGWDIAVREWQAR